MKRKGARVQAGICPLHLDTVRNMTLPVLLFARAKNQLTPSCCLHRARKVKKVPRGSSAFCSSVSILGQLYFLTLLYALSPPSGTWQPSSLASESARTSEPKVFLSTVYLKTGIETWCLRTACTIHRRWQTLKVFALLFFDSIPTRFALFGGIRFTLREGRTSDRALEEDQ